MAEIINGKLISEKMRCEISTKVDELKSKGVEPGLAVIKVGNNPASAIYVRNKILACEATGIKSFSYDLPEETTEDQIAILIDELNARSDVDGILVQLPLPKGVSESRILARISDDKDVDGFSANSIGNLALGKDGFRSCTPYGVMKLLEYSGINPEGKNAVVIGRSNIVGKPMALMLLEKNATVTVCHSRTANLSEVTRRADILVAAIGKALFVTEDMVKDGAVVIDVGINKLDGKTVGDVDYDNVSRKASFITPVPGGVGPMTITMLLFNTLKSAERRI